MATVFFDANAEVPKHVVTGNKSRSLYVMDDNTVIDPYMVRQDSLHDTFADAVIAASDFVDK